MDYRDKSIHKLLVSMTDSYKKASSYYFSDKDLRITSCFYKEDIVGFLKSP